MRRLLPLAAAAAALAACQSEPAIEVSNAIVAASPSSAAVYATIANDGAADQLIGIAIDGRGPIGLHQASNDGGVARMRPVDSLEVPAGGTLELKSGGAHGMAMGRIEASTPSVPLIFRFARSTPIRVSATLTGPGGVAQR